MFDPKGPSLWSGLDSSFSPIAIEHFTNSSQQQDILRTPCAPKIPGKIKYDWKSSCFDLYDCEHKVSV